MLDPSRHDTLGRISSFANQNEVMEIHRNTK